MIEKVRTTFPVPIPAQCRKLKDCRETLELARREKCFQTHPPTSEQTELESVNGIIAAGERHTSSN
jgi:hypothetical protein